MGVALACALMTGCARRMPPVVAPAAPIQPSPAAAPVLFADSFDRLDPERWKEVEVKGKTRYAVEEMGGGGALKAESRGGHASILLTPLRVAPSADVWLSWRWRVEQPVAAEDLRTKKGADAPARIYVYYDIKGLPWQKRSVDYVWSSKLPAGTVLTSPFSKESQMIVANTDAETGVWRTVRRNLREDYLRCFGEDPPDVVALGLMTDADNSGGDAAAYYDDLALTREPAVSPAPSAAP